MMRLLYRHRNADFVAALYKKRERERPLTHAQISRWLDLTLMQMRGEI